MRVREAEWFATWKSSPAFGNALGGLAGSPESPEMVRDQGVILDAVQVDYQERCRQISHCESPYC